MRLKQLRVDGEDVHDDALRAQGHPQRAQKQQTKQVQAR